MTDLTPEREQKKSPKQALAAAAAKAREMHVLYPFTQTATSAKARQS